MRASMKKGVVSICPLCGGKKKKGRTTFSVDLVFGVVVIRNVPATVCNQCGADWFSDKVSQKIEEIVKHSKKKQTLVEISSFQKLASGY